MRLLIDVSSLLWQSLLAGQDKEFGYKVEHEGKQVHVNGWQFGLHCAKSHLLSVMNELGVAPIDMIFVVEGQHSKARRRAIYAGYKEERGSRPPQAYDEFHRCKEELTREFRDIGAQIVTQDGVEADDILAYLAKRLKGDVVILTRDGDMTTLIDDRTSLYQNGRLTNENKYGPFPCKYVPVYKALVGDGEEYKGAAGFGPKAFLDLLVWGGDGILAALEGVIKRKDLHELEDDVAEFKPMRKIIDSAEHVYQSYDCALLHDEWVNTMRQPLRVEPSDADWWLTMNPPPIVIKKNHAIFDCEIIGWSNPVFLVCVRVIETGEVGSFWWHVDGDMPLLHTMLQREDLTWVSFNGWHFDAPMISAAIGGKNPKVLKEIANAIINENGKSWEIPDQFGFDMIKFDHIDLIEVSPGVRVSLKTFAGRMGYPTMVDLPFEHDRDLNEEEMAVLETYCQNDLGVTEWLFQRMRAEIDLRIEMSNEHGIDLRSKSDAQVAEAVLKKAAGIKGRGGLSPLSVRYKAPAFIQTDSDIINDLVERIERTDFRINQGNGQVEAPDFLDEPVRLCSGTYQMGVGGLHSTHDKKLFVEASDEVLISDFDVASYYPNLMLKAGLTPRFDGGGGERFIAEYRKIYDRRMEAKRSGNKKIANALKIALNGTFGKLGSPYSAFYSPDLMLGVTMSGQLNLMCLIYDLEFSPDIKVLSANTDGIMVQYPASKRDRILNVIVENAVRTGFEYEETAYLRVAMKDVNNYEAITADRAPVVITPEGQIVTVKADPGKSKRKGLYASSDPKENPLYLQKNPTMNVCADMAVEYLRDGVPPWEAIHGYTDIKDFVAIRAVKGGGIQYEKTVEVDDWVEVADREWKRQAWLDAGIEKASVKRKSRPAPVEVGVGGQAFGRIARWYMQKGSTLPINYIGSGNKVPKTEGAKLCMTLPDVLPTDLDLEWYINETIDMLGDMGVPIRREPEKLTA